jgi:hypothetical protein
MQGAIRACLRMEKSKEYINAWKTGGSNEITEEYIARLCFGDQRGYLTMLGTSFIDESADERDQTVFVASGFFGADTQWKGFRREWNKALRKTDIRYFKSSECMGLSGEFASLKERRSEAEAKVIALEIRERFDRILRNSVGLKTIAVAMDLSQFKEFNEQIDVRKNPNWEQNYMVATYEAVMGFTAEHLRQLEENEHAGHHIVQFVCDQSPLKKAIDKAYERFVKHFPALGRYMQNEVIHLDDKNQPGLQAADLMAAITREMSKAWLNDPSKQPEPRFGAEGTVLSIGWRAAMDHKKVC